MNKDFEQWNKRKRFLNSSDFSIYFYEREIWWCSIGTNIGFEQDGKGNEFARPVLVLKKYNKNVFIGIPLTTAKRNGKYYYSFPFLNNISTAILSQIRLFDSKRLLRKMGRISKNDYVELRQQLRAIL